MLIEVVTPFFLILIFSGAFWYYIKSPIEWKKFESKFDGKGFSGGRNQRRLVYYSAGKDNVSRKK